MKKESQDQTSFWQQHITEQSKSGVSAASYCRSHGLPVLTFYKWRMRLNGEGHLAFAAVKMIAPAGPARGIRVRVTEFELSGGIEELRAMFSPR